LKKQCLSDDAIDEQAVSYYKRFGFEKAPDSPLLLFFPVRNSGM
jgi:hypothetical protein